MPHMICIKQRDYMNLVLLKINLVKINKRYSQIPYKYLEREGINVWIFTDCRRNVY